MARSLVVLLKTLGFFPSSMAGLSRECILCPIAEKKKDYSVVIVCYILMRNITYRIRQP